MSPRGFFRRLAWVPAALLLACIGGTGTDTDNGINSVKGGPLDGFSGTVVRVADPAGNGIPGVDLFLHTPGYRGDSSAPEDLLLDTVKVPRSDSLGYARFNLLRPGRYVVEARLAGAALFFDTIAVADVKSLSAYTFLRRPSVPAKGAVRLESGLRVASGTVFVRGTGRFARLDSAGGYDLGLLPGDVGRLAIGLSYRAVVQEARIAEQQKPDTSVPANVNGAVPSYTCREASVDSAARFASRDRGTGQIQLDTLITGGFVAGDTAKLDTARLSALERSCDSLAAGTVIAVKSQVEVPISNPARPDSSTTSYITVRGGAREGDIASSRNGTTPELVPLNGCVATPGLVTTSYEVNLIPTSTGGDLYVGDVADKCLR